MTYVIHFCKGTRELPKEPRINPKTGQPINDERCNNAWLDIDTNNAAAPPTWKYCEKCVSEGYVNPAKKPIDPIKSELARQRMLARKEIRK